ncbi:DUF5694 domain-containing protein [Undibacterium sp. Rencai35W]|uniref:DUF5694 domain-containing protein n=1 Tax=Undibacterium sp. Rencai35W TaxID=3413046 RepID=UPI003BEFDFA7
MTTWLKTLGVGALFVCGNALAQTADFDPRDWKKDIAGKPTQVMVLGSPHLSGFGDHFKPAMLSDLIDKLAAFKPDIITIEALSGEQCDTLKRYAATYPDVFSDYCWDPEAAEKATGLTVPAALAEIRTVLKTWPATHAGAQQGATPTPAQRRHLAALFLAANDRFSALVQWQRLDPAERKIGDGVDEALLKVLTRDKTKPNENYEIGTMLAARLGLERVYATDDHTADSIQDLAGPKLGDTLQTLWSKIDIPEGRVTKQREGSLASSKDVLDLYRFYNQPKVGRAFINADFGGALKQHSPELYGRQYVAWWEARNLRMVANIRSAFGNQPGARVLVIVGASHKPYFDAYLNMMHEVKLVDSITVLK